MSIQRILVARIHLQTPMKHVEHEPGVSSHHTGTRGSNSGRGVGVCVCVCVCVCLCA